MTVKEIMKILNLSLVAGKDGLLNNVEGIYVCDLLSWVMSHSKHGDAWITIQTHSNIIAVAALLELSCVIIPENAEIEEDTIKKADEEGIPLLTTSNSAANICSLLNHIINEK